MAERLGLKEARLIVDAMLEEAAKRGLKFSAAVVDAGGDLIHLSRMDGASALNARMSHHKAYTATKWQRDTKAIKVRLLDQSTVAGLGNIYVCEALRLWRYGWKPIKKMLWQLLGFLNHILKLRRLFIQVGRVIPTCFS